LLDQPTVFHTCTVEIIKIIITPGIFQANGKEQFGYNIILLNSRLNSRQKYARA